MVFYFCISYTTRCLYKWYYVKRIVPKNGRSLLIIAAPENIPGSMKNRQGHVQHLSHGGLILSEPLPEGADCALKVVADSSRAESWIRQNWVDEVLILLAPDEAVLKLADAVTSMGITVHLGLDYIRDLLGSGMKTVEDLGLRCSDGLPQPHWLWGLGGEAPD